MHLAQVYNPLVNVQFYMRLFWMFYLRLYAYFENILISWGKKKNSGGQAGAAVTYSDITMHVI